jgi:ferredoxin/flavodoxin---NADP+ reductase
MTISTVGIAPDHQEAKNVTKTLHEVLSNERVRFFGNAEFGSPLINATTLSQHYSAIILATGTASERKLNIPGENSRGVLSSRDFVDWYNGHPLAIKQDISELVSAAKVCAICCIYSIKKLISRL